MSAVSRAVARLSARHPARRILITGATSGSGEALAVLFGRHGWRVAVTGRNRERVALSAKKVRVAGGEVLEIELEVTRYDDFERAARQITEAFPWDSAPKYLIRDNDRAFGVAFKARVRAMGIRDRPTSYRSPWQNGYVERLIGSIRRECTDHLFVFNVEHLRRILSKYASYYNEARTHVSLGKDAPCRRPIEQFGDIVAYPILGGLHHRYARI